MTVPLLQGENGFPPKRAGLAHVSISPYGVFQTADGVPILISIQSDREWAKLCRDVLDKPELATDPPLRHQCRTREEPSGNRRHRRGVVRRTGSRVGHYAASAADIAFARVNDVYGLSAHPQLRRITVGTEKGAVYMPAPGAQLVGASPEFGPVPALGEHTEAVRREFMG